MINRCRGFRFLVLLLAAVFALGGCFSGKRLTKANVAEVVEGMSKKQVESILGLPTAVDTTDLLILKKTTYVYRQGKESITIVFKDDKVESKDSTLSE
jgi:outer membrane protein assembly factor BamE (lipoprotein component of BamABCDE complex)